MEYSVLVPYREFQFNMCNIKTPQYNKYVTDGKLEIKYTYGPCINWNTEILWRIPNTDKIHSVKYAHSSPFAEWWCALVDENEEALEWSEGDKWSDSD